MTSEERRNNALATLSGCTIHQRKTRNMRKVSSFRSHNDTRDKSHVCSKAWIGCERKAKYSTRRMAERVSQKILAERGIPTRIYQCPRCNSYHLTKCAAGEIKQ